MFKPIPIEKLLNPQDLSTTISVMVNNLEVKEIRAILPMRFDKNKIFKTRRSLPVNQLIVGNISFEVIRNGAKSLINKIKIQLQDIAQDENKSILDKLELLNKNRKILYDAYQQYNSMNPIRYMTEIRWLAVVLEKDIEEEYPDSKLKITDEKWSYLQQSFSIRRDLFIEIGYLFDKEIANIRVELAINTKYSWKSEKPLWDLQELLLALISSGQIEYEKGNEATFRHDFMNLFGEKDKDYSRYKGKIFERREPGVFLNKLIKSLKKASTPTQAVLDSRQPRKASSTGK